VDQNLYNHIKQKFDIQRKLHPELLTQIDINEQMTLRQNKANLLALTKCLETGFTPSRSDSNYKSFAIDERDLVLLCSDGVYN
jgi:serine/threonine protein phosphatase PrpC